MYLSSRQGNVIHTRSLTTLCRQGRCAVVACKRPLIGLGQFCRTHRKLQALNGSAYHSPIDKDKSFRDTLKALTPLIMRRTPTPAIRAMLVERAALLTSLPRAPRQGSTRGLKPKALAQTILWHIVAQRKYAPVKQVLLTALAAECTPKLCSSLQYRQAQVARCIYNRLLHSEKRELFGRTIKYAGEVGEAPNVRDRRAGVSMGTGEDQGAIPGQARV